MKCAAYMPFSFVTSFIFFWFYFLSMFIVVCFMFLFNFVNCVFLMLGRERGITVVKVLSYKSEGRWFDPRMSSELFIHIKFFRSHCGTGVHSASNRNEYQEYFLGVKMTVT